MELVPLDLFAVERGGSYGKAVGRAAGARAPARPGPRRPSGYRFSYFSTELSFNALLLGPGAPTQEGVLKAQISQPRLASERVCARAHDRAADPHVCRDLSTKSSWQWLMESHRITQRSQSWTPRHGWIWHGRFDRNGAVAPRVEKLKAQNRSYCIGQSSAYLRHGAAHIKSEHIRSFARVQRLLTTQHH